MLTCGFDKLLGVSDKAINGAGQAVGGPKKYYASCFNKAASGAEEAETDPNGFANGSNEFGNDSDQSESECDHVASPSYF